jgi:arylsulfatase A-like enzyme
MGTRRIALTSLLLVALCSPSIAAQRPNVVLILADDIGWGDIRNYNPNGRVILPAIEKLASEGLRFTDAHSSASKCAPSRYSLITGNYQWRGRSSWGQWNYKGGSQIRSGQETLGHLAKRAGYRTAFIGKYHLGAQFYRRNSDSFASKSLADAEVDFSRRMVDGPPEMGFDYSFVAMRGIQAGPYAFFKDGLLAGDESELFLWEPGDYGDTKILSGGIGLPDWNTRDVGLTLLTRARGFIERRANERAPFFLLVSTQSVHSPHKPPASIGERQIGGTSGLGVRGDMLVEVDAVVESIVRQLERLDVLDDTLIIFTSDNGGLRLAREQRSGHETNGGFRGDKGTIYEGGLRVPLIVKWGDRAFGRSPLPPGTAIDALVGIQDLYATLADLTGISLPVDQARDSFSLLPLLMGESTAVRDHMVHEADRPEDNAAGGGISGRHFAYRSGSWKLVFDKSRKAVGLYNLNVDPFETTNLRSQQAQRTRVARMTTGLETALASDRTAPLGDGLSDSENRSSHATVSTQNSSN